MHGLIQSPSHEHDADCRPERVVVFAGVPHDKNLVRRLYRVAYRMAHDASTNAGIAFDRLSTSAEELHFVAYVYCYLVSAACKCQIQARLRLYVEFAH